MNFETSLRIVVRSKHHAMTKRLFLEQDAEVFCGFPMQKQALTMLDVNIEIKAHGGIPWCNSQFSFVLQPVGWLLGYNYFHVNSMKHRWWQVDFWYV